MKQSNDLKIWPRSLTDVSPENCRMISHCSFCGRNVIIISEIFDVGMTTLAEMTFKCHSRSSNVVPIESSCMSCYYWSIVTSHHSPILDTSCFNAEYIFLPSTIVFDLEFEGQAVGMWTRNFVPEN